MSIPDALGWIASRLVLATFCAKRMSLLRALAIASNIAFIAYGVAASLWPIMVLHAIMLPLNIRRLHEALDSPDPEPPGIDSWPL